MFFNTADDKEAGRHSSTEPRDRTPGNSRTGVPHAEPASHGRSGRRGHEAHRKCLAVRSRRERKARHLPNPETPAPGLKDREIITFFRGDGDVRFQNAI